jgi:hypothetical protein
MMQAGFAKGKFAVKDGWSGQERQHLEIRVSGSADIFFLLKAYRLEGYHKCHA